MPTMASIKLVIILTILIQYVVGYQRIVQVSELFSDDEDFFISGDDDFSTCCVYGNCSCHSLDYALSHLTSNGLINITTDVTLSSLTKPSNLENVLIIGHNNPTVNCRKVGGMHFTFCHNCIIKGITWDGCGTKAEPGLKLSYSSNITIQNCYFQHSIGQAVVLSEVTADVNINHCQFVYNSHYRGHGAAVHYSSSNVTNHLQSLLTVSNCNFTNNKGAKSLVYIENRISEHADNVMFYYSKFCHNQGTSIYAINQKLSLSGKLLFQNNTAKSGAAIYMTDHSTVIFGRNSNVAFIQNLADRKGGAVFVSNHSTVLFDENSKIKFNYNKAARGTIYSKVSSNVTFSGTCIVEFNNNTATKYGAAIYSFKNSHVIFTNSSKVTFSDNILVYAITYYGGIIYSKNYGHISLEDNSSTTFSNNVGGAIVSFHNSNISFKDNSSTIFGNNSGNVGGAIYSNDNSHVSFEDNSSTVFDSNTANYDGGAVYTHDNSHISFEDSSSTVFGNNTAYNGGAIHSDYRNCHIFFEDNSSTTFSNNTAYNGGAIYSYDSHISFEDNSSMIFYNNTVVNEGGSIYSFFSNISFEDSSSSVFGNNIADYGGAIYIYSSDGYISFEDNSSTTFSNNTAYNGGVIYSGYNAHISFKDNSSTTFSNNNADSQGGAIYSDLNGHLSFEDNSSTMFNNNTAEYGGAMYSIKDGRIDFEENSTTEFNNNIAIYHGGAINSFTNNISINEFSTVIFKNNIAEHGGAIFAEINSNITFSDNSTIIFTTNRATLGATVFSYGNSKIIAKENPAIMFDDHSAKWCTNACLPYTGQSDVVTIDGNGIVWCSNQKAFVCLSTKCYCQKLEDSLDNISIISAGVTLAILIITENVMVLSSAYKLNLTSDFSLIGYKNNTIICLNGATLSFRLKKDSYNLIIEGINWIGCGGYNNFQIPVIFVANIYPYESYIKIQNCSFQHSIAPAIGYLQTGQYGSNNNIIINHCNFMNNNYYGRHGGAIYYSSSSYSNNTIVINNCDFSYNHGTSLIYIEESNKDVSRTIYMYINNCNFYNNQGVPIYLSKYVELHIYGKVSFENNVADNGAGIYISDHSTVTFGENSIVKFNNNKAINGTIYSKTNSNVTFKANSKVTFSNNSATQYGAAIYSFDNSHITFTGISEVTFSNNDVSLSKSDADYQFGGTIFSETYGYVSFEENSTTMFYNNIANFGAAIFSIYNSNVIFKDKSRVVFKDNIARTCGTLASALYSSVAFNNHTEVAYDNNTVSCASNIYYEPFAGAICTFKGVSTILSGHSFITFINNTADRGGAVAFSESSVIIQQYSIVIFNKNTALYSSGGAFVCSNNSNVTIKGNSNVTFNNNKANQNGGAIHLYNLCQIIFKENSTSKFVNNSARSNGGATYSMQTSEITIQGNSTVTFDSNTAENGGTFYVTNSTITFNETSMTSFFNNKAIQSGGVGYFSLNSKMFFEGITTARFENNKALYGGAILANDHSNIRLTGNSNISFVNNKATQNGGAGYFYSHCNFVVKENAQLSFTNNKALHGGAVCINDNVKLAIKENSTVLFYINFAIVGGGAVQVLNSSSITLKDFVNINCTKNTAQYGGAIFLDTTAVMANYDDQNCVYFRSNLAKFSGDSVYQDVAGSCNSSCINNRIYGISNDLIATPPNALIFYDPAICIDDDNDTQCNSYYVQNVMLGSEIILPACVLDYYSNQINDSTQFLVQNEMHLNFFTNGPNQILISCDTFQGISIMSNQSLSTSTNFSINISLNVDHDANWKQIFVTLIVGLSPCYPGFWQYPESQKCECYYANDIVFCSGNSSTIKRGYWFGSVTGEPTITFCPINYCNFTCCETTNGYYHLSPLRDDQCRSHRSGTACGSCMYGYTLSFDSIECVNVENCTAGQTVLVILLTVIYWIVMVALVFAMMYYKVGIGYLYSITYYYSIVDILLSQNLQASERFYLTVNIMSSFSKITPQFLGELCLTTGMSGIDQQFIHYVHPSAALVILVIISLLARKSQRISTIISRGIIHVICLLLLLSYTSMASTSLLLIRSLRFHGIDKVYSYLSPDIEYFQGRHLAYGIVALLCTVTIVIGLPLLLTLEPFLNRKINFIKIKPLLDQFQGCYKDRFRCFAGYYMICRLVIITIVIANSSNDFVANYMLIVTCGIIALIHLIIKPYNNEILNKFDGIILQLIIFATALPLFNNFDSPLVIIIAFVLTILPLLKFLAMTLYLHIDDIKKFISHFTLKEELPNNTNDDVNNNETSMKQFYIVVDDSKRKNAIICDM